MKTAIKSSQSLGGLQLLGTLVKVRLSAADSNDGISILEHRMPAGEATPLHIHRNEDEIFHMFSGRMRLEVGGKTVVAEAGDVVMAPKGVPHRFIVEADTHVMTIMRGGDFEAMVKNVARPTALDVPPPPAPPSPEMVNALVETCGRHGIDIIGPPLAA